MQFRVDCECGGHVMVGEGAADALVDCPCGREVRVPPLRDMRVRAGLPPYNIAPEALIENMLDAGELPPDHFCASCRVRQGRVSFVLLTCEKQWTDTGNSWVMAVLAWLFFWPALFFFREGSGKSHGRDKVYRLPLPLCDACRPAARVKECLGNIAVYRQLLDKFPDATAALGE